jgi:hypothetical protein
MDYLRYWSLRHSPFNAAGRFFFVGKAQREVIGWVESLLESGDDFGVVANRGGCGMTTLLGQLCQTRGIGDRATEFVLTRALPERYSRAVDAFALALRLPGGAHSVAAALSDTESESIQKIWLIDEAVPISIADCEELSRRFSSLTVIKAVSRKPDAIAVTESRRLTVLEPLDLCETTRFIKQSLRAAGCTDEPFSRQSIERIHRLSAGRIKNVCELSEKFLHLVANEHSQTRRQAA